MFMRSSDAMIRRAKSRRRVRKTNHLKRLRSRPLLIESLEERTVLSGVYGWTWNDADLDAVWDAGESALEGWTVFLDTDKDGQRDAGEASTTTDANGYYELDGLTPGEYTVAQVVQSGWAQTWPTDASHTVTVGTGNSWVGADFGNAQGAVYGWTWNDADLDALWDASESALEGWTVFLDADNDGQLDTDETNITTDANGYYVFGGLSQGQYAVAQVVQSGWKQTWPTDTTHTVTISTGDPWAEMGFGNAQGAVYGWTWNDADLDAVWDSGESALEGWTVFLDTDKDGQLDSGETSTTTDANGYYVFGGLSQGQYTVAQVVQSGWKQTWPTDTAHTVTISTGDPWAEAGFGNAQGAVYGWLWNDVDLDTVWDTEESALEGWTVFLDTDKDGQLDSGETSTITAANGYYVLGGLSLGQYTVAQVVQSGWKQTWPADAAHTITISSGDLWHEVGFGNAQGAVYGWTWNDADLDAAWDASESALEGWTVFLDADKDGQLDTGETSTTTDADGYYSFGRLPAGEYTVAQVVQNGWEQTRPASSHTVTVSTEDLWAEARFGNAQGAVYGWVWSDADLDAVWDTGESALEGWTVFLDSDEDGQLDLGETSTTTDANGYYAFGALSPGQYTVAQVVPSGWKQTWPTDAAHTVTISTTDLWAEVGFGNARGTVYGWTWNDANLDAVWNADESALEGWTVFLDTDKDGQLDTGETSTTTDANGYYAFGGMSPGEYTVAQVVKTDWGQTWPADAAHTVTISTDDVWAETYFGNYELPIVTIAATDADASEAASDTGTFTITRSGGTAGDLTVRLSIGDSATEDDDFSAIATTAVIVDGQTSVTVTLTPVDDDVAESEETVTLAVEPQGAYSIGAASTATVNIADNDGSLFQNPVEPTDVNDDGNTTPLDVLLVIGYINAGSVGALPDQRDPGEPYCDVDGNGSVTPLDVLLVIDFINKQAVATSEGEAVREDVEQSSGQSVAVNEAPIDEAPVAESTSGFAIASSQINAASSVLRLPEQSQHEGDQSDHVASQTSGREDGVPKGVPGETELRTESSVSSDEDDVDLDEWDSVLTEIARDVSDYLLSDA